MFPELSTEQWTWILGSVGALLLLTIWCMYDACRRFKNDPLTMMIWIQLSIIPFFGAMAYLIFGRKRGEIEK